MNDSTLAHYQAVMMPVFGQPALTLVRGQGNYVWDENGKRYLDLLGGIAVNVLGHAHTAVAQAVADQCRELIHASNFFATPPAVELARDLVGLASEDQTVQTRCRVFLANSGTEANEAALKIIKAWGNTHQKTRIIALERAFHGRSLGALSVTAKAAYREPFAPLLPNVEWIDPRSPTALDSLDQDVAGVIVEPIQGEAGVRELPTGFLTQLRQRCDTVGALLAVDEVQTGMGRTGRWLAHQHTGITPDIVTLAKGLGGGMPIGAVITMTRAASGVLTAGMHGSTFGANPVCAAAARAVIATIKHEGLLAHAAQLGQVWRAQLRQAGGDLVREVRGRGLLIGIELAAPIAGAAVAAGREAGFIINATDEQTLRLAPALNLSQAQAETFTAALSQILRTAQSR